MMLSDGTSVRGDRLGGRGSARSGGLRFGGFTLIELLLVMSIIALMVALLLPALAGAREQAKRTACANQLRQLGIAFITYDQDNRELPPGYWGASYLVGQYVHRKLRDGYGVTTPLTICPTADKYPSTYRPWESNLDFGRMTYHYFGGWGGRPQETPPTPYIVDGWWMGPNYWYLWQTGWKPALFVDQCKFPSRMPMMMDLAYRNDGPPNLYGNKPQRSNHFDSTGQAAGENVLFLDAHVEWHNYVPGKSYRLARDYYEVFWWTPVHVPGGSVLW